MDYGNLNDQEVQWVIKKLKYPKKLLSFEEIKITISSLFGRIDVDELIVDNDDIQYLFHIFRGKETLNALVFIFVSKKHMTFLSELI